MAKFYPDAVCQRCVSHVDRNVWSLVDSTQVHTVTATLKVIHASEDRDAARATVTQVIANCAR